MLAESSTLSPSAALLLRRFTTRCFLFFPGRERGAPLPKLYTDADEGTLIRDGLVIGEVPSDVWEAAEESNEGVAIDDCNFDKDTGRIVGV
jgi:hypothetical protein